MCMLPASPTPARPELTPDLGEILRRYGPSYCATRLVSPLQKKVVRALTSCRTAALGGHLEACDHCGKQRAVYHSCRNRHCPKCQRLAQMSWLEARRADLLPVDYFHVVFTLPHELNRLALFCPRIVYDLLFRAASDTLATFAKDPKRLGGTLGITAILHTWGQNLSLHPHLHCVVTGGALAADGARWIPTRHKGFLFPVRALGKVFRAKYLEGLQRAFEDGELGSDETVPALLQILRQHDWVVYAKPPFAGPERVLAYLGSYTHRIAISNSRIQNMENDRVCFRYRDYADDRRMKVMDLSAEEFIRRFLLHVLPTGFVRMRHYGLLANRFRKQRIAQCRRLLDAEEPEAPPVDDSPVEKLLRLTGVDLLCCPSCSEGRMRVVTPIRKHDTSAPRIEIRDTS